VEFCSLFRCSLFGDFYYGGRGRGKNGKGIKGRRKKGGTDGYEKGKVIYRKLWESLFV